VVAVAAKAAEVPAAAAPADTRNQELPLNLWWEFS